MENKEIIQINNITKNYGKNRGNFDISLNILEHESFGIIGENGAGKTTLLRQIMGFVKPTKGDIKILGYDSYNDSSIIKNWIGYVPGEINFPDLKTGNEFLKNQAELLNVSDMSYANELISRLQLDIRAYPKRMSKGMKQKTAIVVSLMAHKPIIVLDEPTTGLDPLMRDELLKILLEEKKKGTSIIITSNTMVELETLCDRVAYLTQGKIVQIADVNSIKNRTLREYKIEFLKRKDYLEFIKNRKDIVKLKPEQNQVIIQIDKDDIELLIQSIKDKPIKFISEIKYNLSTYFEEKRKKEINDYE